MKTFISVLFLSVFSLTILAQSHAELIDIGLGGISAISKDGNYVCGSNWPNPPFIWSESTGRVDVGTVEGESYSVSNNGIVVGRFRDSSFTIGGDPVLRAGYFANNQWNGFEGLSGVPPLDPQSFTHAYGINSEGNKVVGMVWHPNWRVEACYWSIPDTGIGLLGQAGGYNSRANVVSNDGSIIAGWDGLSMGADRRAFYWDPSAHFMGNLYPNDPLGESRGMNSDGSVIVGGSVWPFIWTQSTGMQQIVADSSLYFSGDALGISDNGIIVGFVRFSVQNYQAFIKMPGWSDIVLMERFIEDSLGITTYPNWYYPFADAISADGNTIGITAYPPGQGAHALVLNLDPTVPVELTNFTANLSGQNVQLSWTTATETNNSGFEIQRKSVNQNWEVLGFVPGRGTTTEFSNYNYTDQINSSGSFSYRLKQIDFDGSFEYSEEVNIEVTTPIEFKLEQNYPNPFNPSTIISFTIAQSSNVNLSVFNIIGERVATVLNDTKDAGSYEVDFNAADLPSGLYIYKLEAGNFTATKKMMLLK